MYQGIQPETRLYILCWGMKGVGIRAIVEKHWNQNKISKINHTINYFLKKLIHMQMMDTREHAHTPLWSFIQCGL